MDSYEKESAVMLDLKSIIEVTIKEIIAAQERGHRSLIELDSIYVNIRHKTITYSIDETIKGKREGDDVKKMKDVLVELIKLYKDSKHSIKFKILEDYDQISLNDFLICVKDVTREKVKNLFIHIFLLPSHTQMKYIKQVSSLLTNKRDHSQLEKIEGFKRLASSLKNFEAKHKKLFYKMNEMKDFSSKEINGASIKNLIRLVRNRVSSHIYTNKNFPALSFDNCIFL